MTALDTYARLESTGRYFDGHSANPREVIVGFGQRTLVIYGKRDEVLAHWPLASLRALSPRGSFEQQYVPQHGAEERLFVEDLTMIEAIEAVCPDLHRRPVDTKGLRAVALWGMGAVASVVLIVFWLVPALAGQLAEIIPPERERAMGDAVVRHVASLLGASGEEDDGMCRSEDGLAALDRMTERLTAVTDLPYPVDVSVLDHEMVNAIAVPGGRIVLFRGLLENARGPEEVAGVLAHELGHVIHRDPTRGALRAAGTAGIFGLLIGDVFGASIIVAAGETALRASYQREAEARADEEAVRILSEAGLPSTPFAGFFARLKERYGDTPAALAYFSSHPALDDRAEKAGEADTIGDRPFEPALDDRGWVALSNICANRS